jgi:hypothetical protein
MCCRRASSAFATSDCLPTAYERHRWTYVVACSPKSERLLSLCRHRAPPPVSGPVRLAAARWCSSNALRRRRPTCARPHLEARCDPAPAELANERLRGRSLHVCPCSALEGHPSAGPHPKRRHPGLVGVFHPSQEASYRRLGAHSERAFPRASDSIPIAAPRLPQTRAASFKWLYRKRPGPGFSFRARLLRAGSLPIQH